MSYKPHGIDELRTAVKLIKVESIKKSGGVTRYEYTDPANADVIFVNWKTYGGTEQTVNGVYSIRDTADITCRYRPDITASCRLLREDGALYQIVSEPENTDMTNRYLEFKAERVKGGAGA